MKGIVFDIQKFSVHDGPGIRTSVFLKGCMMRCIWCHNPESFSKNPELSYKKDQCVYCGRCAEVCRHGVHNVDGEARIHTVKFDSCVACGDCVSECLSGCMSIFGKEMEANEVIAEVLKDKHYYASSNGGVTFTGGEPTIQFEFLLELLNSAKANNLNTCVETNGIIKQENLIKLLPLVDLFLIDYKATGDDLHKQLTGVSSNTVLETLTTLREHNKEVWLRCPVVQGVNDTAEHFKAIKQLRLQHKNITKAEIMAYHSYGKQKWSDLGKQYSLDSLNSASGDIKAEWEALIAIKDSIG